MPFLLYKSTEQVCFDIVYGVHRVFLKKPGNKRSSHLGGTSKQRVKKHSKVPPWQLEF